VVVKKKVTNLPYLSSNLSEDDTLAIIREDSPVFRSALPDFWGGNKQADTYPLVVPLRRKDGRDASQWPRQRLSKDWMLFVRDLNSHGPLDPNGKPDAVNVVFKVEAGWINAAGDPNQQIDPWQIEYMSEDEMPKPEFIVSSGTVVKVLERTSTGIRIDAFDITDPPPSVQDVNHTTAGTRILHFMAGHKNGYYVNISSGSKIGTAQEVYFPVIAPGPAWIPFKDKYCSMRVEFFPRLPKTVITNASLAVRDVPSVYDSTVIEYIKPWTSVTVTRYYPCPTGVWGKIQNGWIALQYLPYKGYSTPKYYTSWRLSGIPNLRPRYTQST